MESLREVKIAGHRCRISKAPEPTNIIWQNVGYDPSRRFVRILIMIVVSFTIFAITFLLMKSTANRQAYYLDKYDQSISCDVLENFYGPQ